MRKYLLSSVLAIGLAGGLHLSAKGSDEVRQAQQALKDKGFDPGEADGIIGSKTRKAIMAYQKKNNIVANGRLGGETYDSLGVKRSDAGNHMDKAGTNMKKGYGTGGKEMAQGGKDSAESIKDGKVTDAAVDLGKGVGHGAAKMGKGTGSAAKNAAKSVKDAFTPSNKSVK